ncbi:helix-turn-helix domain-containing protein [Campylobacter lari]|uniref:helix-turn-helix domain-containing protein n=1 Tax=Campylobacter lari TaxID=201 RepID=UPI00214A70BE|nr:helix-turn-helix domain-containing protein [Campylobacter lari]MCR2068702.1 helix-turn-helix domain-containing protein [Campylobacter lari subsp. concheus]
MNENYLETKDFLSEKYKKMTLSKEEFAEVLGVSSGTIDNLRRKGKIQSIEVSRYVLFSIEEIAKVVSGVKSLMRFNHTNY